MRAWVLVGLLVGLTSSGALGDSPRVARSDGCMVGGWTDAEACPVVEHATADEFQCASDESRCASTTLTVTARAHATTDLATLHVVASALDSKLPRSVHLCVADRTQGLACAGTLPSPATGSCRPWGLVSTVQDPTPTQPLRFVLPAPPPSTNFDVRAEARSVAVVCTDDTNSTFFMRGAGTSVDMASEACALPRGMYVDGVPCEVRAQVTFDVPACRGGTCYLRANVRATGHAPAGLAHFVAADFAAPQRVVTWNEAGCGAMGFRGDVRCAGEALVLLNVQDGSCVVAHFQARYAAPPAFSAAAGRAMETCRTGTTATVADLGPVHVAGP